MQFVFSCKLSRCDEVRSVSVALFVSNRVSGLCDGVGAPCRWPLAVSSVSFSRVNIGRSKDPSVGQFIFFVYHFVVIAPPDVFSLRDAKGDDA